MLSGIKFIPRDQLLSSSSDKPQSSSNDSSSDSDDVGSMKSTLRRKKRRRHDLLDDYSSSSDEYEKKRGKKKKHKKHKEKRKSKDDDYDYRNTKELARKELGLDWMLRPAKSIDNNTNIQAEEETEEHKSVEMQKPNPKELNPYLKDNGTGYPNEASMHEGSEKTPPSVVGDGGASWRLKALKRAKEQAAREGRRLDEVVEERWGSLGHSTASVVASRTAHGRAHLHAIRDRRKGQLNFQKASHVMKLIEAFRRYNYCMWSHMAHSMGRKGK